MWMLTLVTALETSKPLDTFKTYEDCKAAIVEYQKKPVDMVCTQVQAPKIIKK